MRSYLNISNKVKVLGPSPTRPCLTQPRQVRKEAAVSNGMERRGVAWPLFLFTTLSTASVSGVEYVKDARRYEERMLSKAGNSPVLKRTTERTLHNAGCALP